MTCRVCWCCMECCNLWHQSRHNQLLIQPSFVYVKWSVISNYCSFFLQKSYYLFLLNCRDTISGQHGANIYIFYIHQGWSHVLQNRIVWLGWVSTVPQCEAHNCEQFFGYSDTLTPLTFIVTNTDLSDFKLQCQSFLPWTWNLEDILVLLESLNIYSSGKQGIWYWEEHDPVPCMWLEFQIVRHNYFPFIQLAFFFWKFGRRLSLILHTKFII